MTETTCLQITAAMKAFNWLVQRSEPVSKMETGRASNLPVCVSHECFHIEILLSCVVIVLLSTCLQTVLTPQQSTVECCQIQQMDLLISAVGQRLNPLQDTVAILASNWKVLPRGYASAVESGPAVNLHACVSPQLVNLCVCNTI